MEGLCSECKKNKSEKSVSRVFALAIAINQSKMLLGFSSARRPTPCRGPHCKVTRIWPSSNDFDSSPSRTEVLFRLPFFLALSSRNPNRWLLFSLSSLGALWHRYLIINKSIHASLGEFRKTASAENTCSLWAPLCPSLPLSAPLCPLYEISK